MARRPQFMVTLGLLPPLSEEDVKRAYLAKVKSAHPDHGGSRTDFDAIQQAYQQAQEYLKMRSDRRGWIRARVDEYLAVGTVVEQLEAFGAEVKTNAVDWLKESFGDFAELTTKVTGIKLAGGANCDQLINTMVVESASLRSLERLELPGCPISDKAVLQLRVFESLTHLDLSDTPVTASILEVIDWLPRLETLELEGTSIGWSANRKVRSILRSRQKNRELKRVLRAKGGI